MSPSTIPALLLSTSRAVVRTQTDTVKKTATKPDGLLANNALSDEAERKHSIAVAAYLRAEQRHFEPGHDVEDWLAAESAFNRHQPPVDAAPSS